MERLDLSSLYPLSRATEADMTRPPAPLQGTLAKKYLDSFTLFAIRNLTTVNIREKTSRKSRIESYPGAGAGEEGEHQGEDE